MAWIVQALEKKNQLGEGSGIWHLCAESDEGGGFHVGCDHYHATALGAQNCEEAQRKIDQITGMPSGDYGWGQPKRSGSLKDQLIQDLHAGISRRDWHAVELAANRLRDET